MWPAILNGYLIIKPHFFASCEFRYDRLPPKWRLVQSRNGELSIHQLYSRCLSFLSHLFQRLFSSVLLLLHITHPPRCRKTNTFLGLSLRKITSSHGYLNTNGCHGKKGLRNIPSNTIRVDHSSRSEANAISFGKGLEDGDRFQTHQLHGPVPRPVGLRTEFRDFRRASLPALLPSGQNLPTLGLVNYCSRCISMGIHAIRFLHRPCRKKKIPSPQFHQTMPCRVGQYITSINLALLITDCLLSLHKSEAGIPSTWTAEVYFTTLEDDPPHAHFSQGRGTVTHAEMKGGKRKSWRILGGIKIKFWTGVSKNYYEIWIYMIRTVVSLHSFRSLPLGRACKRRPTVNQYYPVATSQIVRVLNLSFLEYVKLWFRSFRGRSCHHKRSLNKSYIIYQNSLHALAHSISVYVSSARWWCANLTPSRKTGCAPGDC
jgi:hypothetical protein